jgi:hypothetical protein
VLAVQDAIALAAAVREVGPAGLDAALGGYDRRRRTQLSPVQGSAMRSMRWFEDVDRHLAEDPVRVAWSLFDRRGDQAAWRYQLHLATQIEPLRQARRRITAARRTVRERQRERSVVHGE